MKIRSLELRNYRRHRSTVIEWPDGVIAILGRNGAGKSSILEAIGFALFGVPATRTGKDLLRWDGSGPMDTVSVALEFELGGQAIRIHRELRGKGLTPSATLTVDGRVAVDPGAGSNEAVTADVETRIGMDRETFFTTLVAHQKDLDRLAEMTPAKRKQLLLEMLGIDALDRAIEHARQLRRDAETKLSAQRDALPDRSALEADIQSAKQTLAQADNHVRVAEESWKTSRAELTQTAGARAELERKATAKREAETALARATEQRDAEARQLDGLSTRLEAARLAEREAEVLLPTARTLDALTARLQEARTIEAAWKERTRFEQELERKAKSLPAVDPVEAAKLRSEWDAAREQSAAAERTGAVASSRAAHHRKHLDDLAALGDAAVCPTCERPMANHLPELEARLESERVEAETEATKAADDAAQWHAEAAALKKKLDALETALQEHNQLEAQRELLPAEPAERLDVATVEAEWQVARAAHEQHLRLHELVTQRPHLEKERNDCSERVQKFQIALDAASKAFAELPDVGAELDGVVRAHEAATKRERDGERAALSAQAAQQVAQQAVRHATERMNRHDEQSKKLRQTEEDARYLAAVAGGRGKGLLEEFKAHLVARIGPAIGREASRLLERFTQGRYTEVTLDTEYNVYVSDGGRRYALERFSGGESDLVHLALRLSVSRLLVERNAAEMRFLALDEVFGSLDAERRNSVLAALQELGSLYSQVLLVTHHDDLRDALDAALMVEERDGQAHVSLHVG